MNRENEPVNPDLAQTMKTLRDRRQVSVRELAKRLGVNKDTITDFEKARKLPTLGTLQRFCEQLPVLPEEAHTLAQLYTLPITGTSFSLNVRRSPMVGREAEMAQLQAWLNQALRGQRQIIFVTGKEGVGKTTLIDAFLQHPASVGDLWLAKGQCYEYYGTSEAYLPILTALDQLYRKLRSEQLVEVLKRHAPTWLVQLPTLVSAADLEVLQRKTQGATQERMLREMAEALEALTVEKPLVLWLEDLQWSDYSTLTLLPFLARRQERARLLVIGTYRPVEMTRSGHPPRDVQQELRAEGLYTELPLECLTEPAVDEYFKEIFPKNHLPIGLAGVIHQHTGGNPLFMNQLVQDLLERGVITQVEGRWELVKGLEEVKQGVPKELRSFIKKRFDRLNGQERRVLESASVAEAARGEFSATAVAAGLRERTEEIVEICESLVRRNQVLQQSQLSPACYQFKHQLYQNFLHSWTPAGRRSRLHRKIGEYREKEYQHRVQEIAGELAIHFEQGQDLRQAVRYLERAGENAIRRGAHTEAISLFTKGLELLKTLPDTPERTQQELTLQVTRGAALMATQGVAAPEVERTYLRALTLCTPLQKTPYRFPALRGLWAFYLTQANLQKALEWAERFLQEARSEENITRLEAYRSMGITLYWRGELTSSRIQFEESIKLYDDHRHRSSVVLYQQDPKVSCLSHLAHVLWYLGYPDQALEKNHEALILAQELDDLFALASALSYAATAYQLYRNEPLTKEQTERTYHLSNKQGFAQILAKGTILRGWALVDQGRTEEGINQIRRGLEAYQATNAALERPYFLAILAEAYGRGRQVKEGLTVLAEALAMVEKTGARSHEAELYRLKGELLLKSGAQKEAETCFRRAITIARHQQGKSLELRAVMSLSRLWQKQDKKAKARQMLAEIYGWFTEGFDTADLQEARALLNSWQ